MMTDLPFWTKQFALLANANYEHTRGIQKVIDNQAQYLETLKERGLKGRDEKRFYKEVKSLNEIFSQQLEKMTTDANEYVVLEKALKSFDDKNENAVCRLDQRYKLTREKLDALTKQVEIQKKMYHKQAFSGEKMEIKAKMAYQPDVIYETKKKLDEAQAKATNQISKYTKYLEKWQAKFSNLQKISDDIEEAFQSREEARAKVVLSSLQNSVDLTMAGNYTKREAAFKQIKQKRFVNEKLIEKEQIQVPSFQIYTGELSKEDMYANAKAELEAKDYDKTKSMNLAPELDDKASDVTQACEINKKLSQLSKSTIFIVVKAYEKQEINQLNLKTGEHVTQLLPANEDGFAYGQVFHGLFHKKKKGFYPVSHVVQIQTETKSAEADQSENLKIRKKSTKLVKEMAPVGYEDGVPRAISGVVDLNSDKSDNKVEELEVKKVGKEAWANDDDTVTKIRVINDARRRRRRENKKARERTDE